VISVVVSTFTAPLNVLVDVLFEDILMAPTAVSKRKKVGNESRLGERMTRQVRRLSTDLSNAVSVAAPRSTVLVRAIGSKLRGAEGVQRREMPEETIAAHGRATRLVARSLSTRHVVSSDAGQSENAHGGGAVLLIDKLQIDIQNQRKYLNKRELFSFDSAWRLVLR
jgi:hypothetical protein